MSKEREDPLGCTGLAAVIVFLGMVAGAFLGGAWGAREIRAIAATASPDDPLDGLGVLFLMCPCIGGFLGTAVGAVGALCWRLAAARRMGSAGSPSSGKGRDPDL
jgi:hypothetical protein